MQNAYSKVSDMYQEQLANFEYVQTLPSLFTAPFEAVKALCRCARAGPDSGALRGQAGRLTWLPPFAACARESSREQEMQVDMLTRKLTSLEAALRDSEEIQQQQNEMLEEAEGTINLLRSKVRGARMAAGQGVLGHRASNSVKRPPPAAGRLHEREGAED